MFYKLIEYLKSKSEEKKTSITSPVVSYRFPWDASETDETFAITLVGEAQAGKSALLTRFVDGNFVGRYASTIGVEFVPHPFSFTLIV